MAIWHLDYMYSWLSNKLAIPVLKCSCCHIGFGCQYVCSNNIILATLHMACFHRTICTEKPTFIYPSFTYRCDITWPRLLWRVAIWPVTWKKLHVPGLNHWFPLPAAPSSDGWRQRTCTRSCLTASYQTLPSRSSLASRMARSPTLASLSVCAGRHGKVTYARIFECMCK